MGISRWESTPSALKEAETVYVVNQGVNSTAISPADDEERSPGSLLPLIILVC